MHSFVVGFNPQTLQAYAKKQKWSRTKVSAKGWMSGVSGQSDARLWREYAKGCFRGMGPGNAKLYVVNPKDRGGYFPDTAMKDAVEEAKGLGIEVIEVCA